MCIQIDKREYTCYVRVTLLYATTAQNNVHALPIETDVTDWIPLFSVVHGHKERRPALNVAATFKFEIYGVMKVLAAREVHSRTCNPIGT